MNILQLKDALKHIFLFLEKTPSAFPTLQLTSKEFNKRVTQYLSNKIKTNKPEKQRAQEALRDLFIPSNPYLVIKKNITTMKLPTTLNTSCYHCKNQINPSFNHILEILKKGPIKSPECESIIKNIQLIDNIPIQHEFMTGTKFNIKYKNSVYLYGRSVIILLFFVIAYSPNSKTQITSAKMLCKHFENYKKFTRVPPYGELDYLTYLAKLADSFIAKNK